MRPVVAVTTSSRCGARHVGGGHVSFGHLDTGAVLGDHGLVFRRPEPALDRETVDGIEKLMAIDEKLVRVLPALEVEDDEEEDDA